MWWECIPSFSVIVVAIGMVPMVPYLINQLEIGNVHRRQIVYNIDAHFFLRDERVSGKDNAYLQKGLENIPDEGSTSTSKSGTAKC